MWICRVRAGSDIAPWYFTDITCAGLSYRPISRFRLMPYFQHAQQLDLNRRGNVSDFVQKQVAAVTRFKTTDTIPERTGERASHVSEQFAFQQGFVQCRAVELDVRAGAALFDNGENRSRWVPLAK